MTKKCIYKILTIIILWAISICETYSQIKPSGWDTYSIPDVCSFAIPSTMEVRSDDSFHGRFVKAMQQGSFFEMLCDNCDLFYEEATLVLQPKGLNNNPYSASFQQANDSYARIMFNFSYDELTQEDVKELTPSDLKELNQIIYEDVKREFDCIADIIPTSGQLKWYLLCKKNISGFQTLVEEYDRPALEGGQTHVKIYMFFYDKKLLKVTTSYKIKEESKYKNDFEKFIQLLKIETQKSSKQVTTSNSSGLFSSTEYHFKYAYDKTQYTVTPKQNQSSHCFCKLESNNGNNFILFSAWDIADESTVGSVFEEDFISQTKQMDNNYNFSNARLLSSCQKTIIGGKEALKSVFLYEVMGIKIVHTTYRVYYKGKLFTLDFHIPEIDFNKNLPNELAKGIQFN